MSVNEVNVAQGNFILSSLTELLDIFRFISSSGTIIVLSYLKDPLEQHYPGIVRG